MPAYKPSRPTHTAVQRAHRSRSESAQSAAMPTVAHGRSLRDFLPLMSAEERLLQACCKGEIACINRDDKKIHTTVRADFLRFLLLGGDEKAPVHERGVRLSGAIITESLDLEGCCVPHSVALTHCCFGSALIANDARIQGSLTLRGSELPKGMKANGIHCAASLFLSDGFKATAEVRLHGAQIGGDIDCSGGQFNGRGDYALLLDNALVKGCVLLADGFKSVGEVRLLGAQIGGNLVCRDGQFYHEEGDALSADRVTVKGSVFLDCKFVANGKVRLVGAHIGSNLDCMGGCFDVKGGDALSLEKATIQGTLFLSKKNKSLRVNAGHAQVAVLEDSVEVWDQGSVLDGFRYSVFGGDASTRASERLKWLRQQAAPGQAENSTETNFRPQPWKQLQHVLNQMGHAEDARQVGIAFETQLRRIGRIGDSAPTKWTYLRWVNKRIAIILHVLFGFLAGYGYRPMRLVFAMALVWLICGITFWYLALPPYSAIGPSDPLVFQSEKYRDCRPPIAKDTATTKSGNWYVCSDLAPEYSTFSPLIYSLDIILPLVNLGQENTWGPLVPTPRKVWWEELRHFSAGHLVRVLVWFETLFGWVASLLLVGIASGFAKRTEEHDTSTR